MLLELFQFGQRIFEVAALVNSCASLSAGPEGMFFIAARYGLIFVCSEQLLRAIVEFLRQIMQLGQRFVAIRLLMLRQSVNLVRDFFEQLCQSCSARSP